MNAYWVQHVQINIVFFLCKYTCSQVEGVNDGQDGIWYEGVCEGVSPSLTQGEGYITKVRIGSSTFYAIIMYKYVYTG